jgi:ribonuclease HI
MNCSTERVGRPGRKPRRRQGTSPERLKIAWTNVGRSQPCHITALEVGFADGMDVVCIQEPWTYRGTRTQNHPGYTSHAPLDCWDTEEDRPRVMTYVRRGVKLHAQQRRPERSRDRLWLDVNGLAILNFYREPTTPDLVEYIAGLAPPARCVAGGDANATHDLWEPGAATRAGGSHIAEWSQATGMEYTGTPGEPTHRAGHVLDLVFSNVAHAETRVRSELHSGSDHETLVTIIPTRGTAPVRRDKYVVGPEKEDRFADLFAHYSLSLRGPDTITVGDRAAMDRWVEAFDQAWEDSLQGAGSPASGRGRTAPWWTEGCKIAWTRWKESRRVLTGEDLAVELRTFKREIKRAKRQYWADRIDKATSDQALYEIVAWHKQTARLQAPPIVIGNRVIEDTAEKARALTDGLVQRFSAEDDLDYDPLASWEEVDGHPGLKGTAGPASEEEVEACVIGVTSTSPGIDTTTVRLLKAAWPTAKSLLHGFYNKCLESAYFPTAWKRAEVVMIPKPNKKDLSQVRSWRPIALISCVSKGFERLLARRMSTAAIQCGVVSERQAGALPGRAATDLVAAFVHDAEWALAMRRVASIALVDVQGAFDALLWRRLLARMRKQGWPLPILQLTQSFLSGRLIRTRLGDVTTDLVPTQCGTPQGSPWSPLLYTLYLAELVQNSTSMCFCYADDVAFYTTGRSLQETTKELQASLRRALRWADANKVRFAPEKYELLHITKARSGENPPIDLGDGTIITPVPLQADVQTDGESPARPAMRWLGVWLQRDLGFQRHVDERRSIGLRLVRHLRALTNSQRGLPAASVRKAAMTCVIPAITYGSEVWYRGRTKPARNPAQSGKDLVSSRLGGQIDKLQVVMNAAARAILPVWRTTPNHLLSREAGIPTAELVLEESRHRFALRLQKVPGQHPLTARIDIPTIRRGKGAGTTFRPRTCVQVAGALYKGSRRPVLTTPRYTKGSRLDPVQGTKEDTAKAFQGWLETLTTRDLVVFTDGSKTEDGLGYGYTITRPDGRTGQVVTARGAASLDTCATVFDAEAVGALRGLQRACELRTQEKIWLCLDNTAVIWCLRGRASTTSQWALLKAQELIDKFGAEVKWCPGHMGIQGNEMADEEAKRGVQAPRDREAGPTLAGMKAMARQTLRENRGAVWRKATSALSGRYTSWGLEYDYGPCPEQLKLGRTDLHRLLAIRTGHGDFAWYHRKYHPEEEVNMRCSCGMAKTPDHLVHCRKTRTRIAKWPRRNDRPVRTMRTPQDRNKYLRELLDDPSRFAKFLKVTGFYKDICLK